MALVITLKSAIFISFCKLALTLHRRDIDASLVGGSSKCESGWIFKWQHCYQLQRQLMTWERAVCHCQQKGGNLVSIHSKEQQDYFTDILKKASSKIWIGLHDTGSEGEYAWKDGSNFDYKNWARGEPSGFIDTKEDCVEMRNDTDVIGSWNDAPCNHEKAFICQKNAQNEDYTNEVKSNNCGLQTATTFMLTIIFITVAIVQMGGMFYYRRLWLEGKRMKGNTLVFQSEMQGNTLTTEFDMKNEESNGEPKYVRL